MAAHDVVVAEMTIAGVSFSNTKKTMQQYWHEQGQDAEFEEALKEAHQKFAELLPQISTLEVQMEKLDRESDAFEKLAVEKKNLETLQRGLKRNLPRHTDVNVGLDASAAALVWIGVKKKDGTVEPRVMIYDSARKDPTWAGKSLVAINGKIEIAETDPRSTMAREVQEELLNSSLGAELSAKIKEENINQSPNYSTNSIAIKRILSGQDCYLNQTTFVFGGTYEEDALNDKLNEINASMERLLGSDTAPASLFIKHVLPGPQAATPCKNPALAKEELLQGLTALIEWHHEPNPAEKSPLTEADYKALTALRDNITSGSLDLSNAKDVAVVKKAFEEHVYCYTEAKKVHLLSKDEFYTVAQKGIVATSHGEVSMPGFIYKPLGEFLAKEKAASEQKEGSTVFGRPGSPTFHRPAPANNTTLGFEKWLETKASPGKVSIPKLTR